MARADAYPENTEYRDKGCLVHPACLTCPLAVCVLDIPPHVQQRWSRNTRVLAMVAGEMAYEQIALLEGISTRTVYRIVAAAPGARVAPPARPEMAGSSPVVIDASAAVALIQADTRVSRLRGGASTMGGDGRASLRLSDA